MKRKRKCENVLNNTIYQLNYETPTRTPSRRLSTRSSIKEALTTPTKPSLSDPKGSMSPTTEPPDKITENTLLSAYLNSPSTLHPNYTSTRVSGSPDPDEMTNKLSQAVSIPRSEQTLMSPSISRSLSGTCSPNIQSVSKAKLYLVAKKSKGGFRRNSQHYQKNPQHYLAIQSHSVRSSKSDAGVSNTSDLPSHNDLTQPFREAESVEESRRPSSVFNFEQLKRKRVSLPSETALQEDKIKQLQSTTAESSYYDLNSEPSSISIISTASTNADSDCDQTRVPSRTKRKAWTADKKDKSER